MHVIPVGLLLTLVFAVNAIASVPEQTEVETLINNCFEAMNHDDVGIFMKLSVDTRQNSEESKALYEQLR